MSVSYEINTNNVYDGHILNAVAGDSVSIRGTTRSDGYMYALSNNSPSISGLTYLFYGGTNYLVTLSGTLAESGNIRILRTDFGKESSYSGLCGYLALLEKPVHTRIVVSQSTASQSDTITMTVGSTLVVDQEVYTGSGTWVYGVADKGVAGATYIKSRGDYNNDVNVMCFTPTQTGTYTFKKRYGNSTNGYDADGTITVIVTGAPVSTTNIKVKVGETWKDGKAYVKVNGVWKESNKVYTKVNGVWKENA